MRYVPEAEFKYRCKTCKNRQTIHDEVSPCETCGDIEGYDNMGEFCIDNYEEDTEHGKKAE